MQKALIVFVKNPELGKAKTRLAATIGDEKALEVYKALLTKTNEVASSVDALRCLYYKDEVTRGDEWSENNFSKFVQPEGDLGIKMKTAFREQFEAGAEQVVIIGSDCWEISKEIVAEAYLQLESNDVVFGPSQDGGYYLLGMKRLVAELFDNMPWSTEELLDLSKQKLEVEGVTYAELTVLNDIDTEEDLRGFPELIKLLEET